MGEGKGQERMMGGRRGGMGQERVLRWGGQATVRGGGIGTGASNSNAERARNIGGVREVASTHSEGGVGGGRNGRKQQQRGSESGGKGQATTMREGASTNAEQGCTE